MSHIENQYQRRDQPVGPMLMCTTCLSGYHSKSYSFCSPFQCPLLLVTRLFLSLCLLWYKRYCMNKGIKSDCQVYYFKLIYKTVLTHTLSSLGSLLSFDFTVQLWSQQYY